MTTTHIAPSGRSSPVLARPLGAFRRSIPPEASAGRTRRFDTPGGHASDHYNGAHHAHGQPRLQYATPTEVYPQSNPRGVCLYIWIGHNSLHDRRGRIGRASLFLLDRIDGPSVPAVCGWRIGDVPPAPTGYPGRTASMRVDRRWGRTVWADGAEGSPGIVLPSAPRKGP